MSTIEDIALSRELVPLSLRVFGPRVVGRLLEWFEREGRSFIWRTEDLERIRSGEPIHDPYLILVSEVMLQQTQTSRVAARLPQFLARFPTIGHLADAPRADLLRAWQGMGYNRRALRLQETAQAIVREHGGAFPTSVGELARLPGLGPYTASAIACFAFGQRVPVVDVNVIRVLSRLFYKCHTAAALAPERSVRAVAAAVVPEDDAYRWHQALMDLGATICVARRPLCERCPLERECLSAHPRALELFDGKKGRKPEPALRGVPRRIWRGRIVEMLRRAEHPLPVREVLDMLEPAGEPGLLVGERGWLLAVTATLIEEGLVARAGGVHEGELGEADTIGLP
jgi:A/G-specific adenine glycosylase